jgi:acyl-CoA synthetase (AMP-forming)/AMP-acid ligase II/thioesterase domain-containing protein
MRHANPPVSFARCWQDAVQRSPNMPAVRDAHAVWSFAELDRRIGEIAAAATELGPPGSVVGVIVAKTAWSLAAMFGIARAGRTALLLDPDDPPGRWAENCARLDATVVLADDPAARALVGEVGLVSVDPSSAPRSGADDASVAVPTDPDADAWIICTSGSTGVPKLVAVSHAVNANSWIRNSARNEVWGDLGSAVLVLPPLSAAAARMVLSQAWAGGACAVLVDTPRTPPDRLLGLIDEHDVHRLHLGPWLLRSLVTAASIRGRGSSAVSVIVSTGAALGTDDVAAAWRWFPNARIVSHYGSTEVAAVASVELVPGADLCDPDVMAMTPVAGEVLVVADAVTGCPAPTGEQGEIWVRSPTPVARYRDAPDLDEHLRGRAADGTTWIRTGDLGRLLPDGRLHVDGRDDARVKINGVAVDLNALTTAVRALEGVADAEVSVIERGDDVRLVAWVVADGSRFLTVRDLRAGLRRRLPDGMIPHVFRAISEIPRLRTGKADRVALRNAAAEVLPMGGERRMPTTTVEHELAARFAAALDGAAVGVNESFFELGGDSLGALDLLTGIVDRYAVPDERRPALESAMMTDGTVAALARVLEAPDLAGVADASVVDATVLDSRLRPDGVSVLVLGRGPAEAVPIVLLSGGGQDPLSFRPLVRHLTGQRVWTLTPRGFRTRVPADRSLDRMVARYADALLEREPRATFVVAGFSFGGVAAQHLATELVARGAHVPLLTIIDAPRPGTPRRRRRDPAARAPLWVRIPRGLAFRTRWWYLGATAGIVRRQGWVQGEAFLSRAGSLLCRCVPRPFDGPVVVVRSAESVADGLPPDLGWSAVCHGPLATIDLPGNHFAMLLEPTVERIGQVLAAAAVTSRGSG